MPQRENNIGDLYWRLPPHRIVNECYNTQSNKARLVSSKSGKGEAMNTSSRVSASSCGSQAIRTRYRQDHYNPMHIVRPVLMLYESSLSVCTYHGHNQNDIEWLHIKTFRAWTKSSWQLYTTNQLMASPRRFTATGSGIIKITWQK